MRDLVTPAFYSEGLSLTDMESKAGSEKLQGCWVMEIAELAGMKKADIEKTKAFLSMQDDKYRPAYGRTVESHPRSSICIATVNGERGYLRDITGNRRFWVVKLSRTTKEKTWSFDDTFRAQFWAQAKAYWRAGEKLYLEGDVANSAEEAQRAAMEQDERVGMVEQFLDQLVPANWGAMTPYARHDYIEGGGQTPLVEGTLRRMCVSNQEIWCECFGNTSGSLKPRDSHELGSIMAQISGWEKGRIINRKPYGKQRTYFRKGWDCSQGDWIPC